MSLSLLVASSDEAFRESVRDNLLNQPNARLIAEYHELPSLGLTAAQASRLLAIELRRAEVLLQSLVADGLLRMTRDQRYVVHGPPGRPRALAGTEAAA